VSAPTATDHPLASTPRTVLVLGGGLLGSCTAWALLQRGHRVRLIDPDHADGGSWAALGVLMAQVFHRTSGRAWRLRQRSLELWRRWIPALEARGHHLPWRSGLLLLADDADAEQRLRRLALDRQALQLPVSLWEPERLAALAPALPGPARLALHSPADGQLDPGAAIAAFRSDALRVGLEWIRDRAVALEPLAAGGWRVRRMGGDPLEAEWLVLAAGLEGQRLLDPLGLAFPLEPVLGQALELELAADDPAAPALGWPGVVNWQGINLIPRPDLPGGRRLWLGATLEPGACSDPDRLAALACLHGQAPPWLRRAQILRQWQGLRPRPLGRPAPLLEQPLPGLLLAGGHYRNGVLLAPATAAWVCEQLERP